MPAAGSRHRHAGHLGAPGLDRARGPAQGVGRDHRQGRGGCVPPHGPHPPYVRAASGAGSTDPCPGAAPPVPCLLPVAGLGPGRHVHKNHSGTDLHGPRLVAQDRYRAALSGRYQEPQSDKSS